jgi:hypothetical protein
MGEVREREGEYGEDSRVRIMEERMPMPVWGGGTDEWPPGVCCEGKR